MRMVTFAARIPTGRVREGGKHTKGPEESEPFTIPDYSTSRQNLV
jgi:hypothetical protein